jgi:OOP family OmpA-OmpF porin
MDKPWKGKHRHSKLTAICAMAAGLATPAAAADRYDDRAYIAPMLSYVFADDDRYNKDGYGGALALGKQISPYLGVELRGSYLYYSAESGEEPGLLCNLLGLNCPYQPSSTTLYGIGAALNLYPFMGGLYIHADAMGGSSTQYNVGLGYDALTLGGGAALRIEALYHMNKDFEEPRINLGMRIPFGAAAKPAPPPPPPPPMAAPRPEPVRVVSLPPCELPASGQPVSLAGCKVGDTVVLHGLEFEFDSEELTAKAKRDLDLVIQALRDRPDIKVEIRGHTDSMGSQSYNDDLSERRAYSVLHYLVEGGIATERLTARGFGENSPIADNATDEGRARNRRVELYVTDIDAVPQTAAPTPDAPGAQGNEVIMQDMRFTPSTIVVAPGTTVIWRNEGSSNHVVRFPDQESFRIPPGETYRRRFDRSGEFSYVCGIHPSMTGKVIVRQP